LSPGGNIATAVYDSTKKEITIDKPNGVPDLKKGEAFTVLMLR